MASRPAAKQAQWARVNALIAAMASTLELVRRLVAELAEHGSAAEPGRVPPNLPARGQRATGAQRQAKCRARKAEAARAAKLAAGSIASPVSPAANDDSNGAGTTPSPSSAKRLADDCALLERAAVDRRCALHLREELSVYTRQRAPRVLDTRDPADQKVIETLSRFLAGRATTQEVISAIVVARSTWARSSNDALRRD